MEGCLQSPRQRLAEPAGAVFATGLGLHSLSIDREDDGGGATGFLQAQAALRPGPMVGLVVGVIAQGHSGFGVAYGGTAVGGSVGIDIGSDGW